MRQIEHPCVYCGDPVYTFQEVYHKGCAEIYLEERMKKLKESLLPTSTSKRPPLGLMPKKIHDEKRIESILEAMIRYTKEGKSIPPEWISELWSFYK